jgi:hypothetical protein
VGEGLGVGAFGREERGANVLEIVRSQIGARHEGAFAQWEKESSGHEGGGNCDK